MLIVISPAKRLDWPPVGPVAQTDPRFIEDAARLANIARGLSLEELQKLMSISPELARLNAVRFAEFAPRPDDSQTRPAMCAFAGDTYTGLEAGSLDMDEVAWAQDHLRILSGLYGLLRPLDGIQPYRLEMGSRLETSRGRSLYDFWGHRIAEALNEQAQVTGADTLINCASQEYFGAVDRDTLKLRIITPVFLEDKPQGPKIVSFYAKKARGAMARFVIQQRVFDTAGLRDFDAGGYRFQPTMSSLDAPVFLRSQDAAQSEAA